MQFSQAARLRLFAIDRNRQITLNSLGLRDRMNVSAAIRIPRDGEFLFGGKFLDCVDSDISMHKRAKEVAGRLAKPRFSDALRRQRFRPFTSLSSCGRGQSFRVRGRGSRRSVRGRGTAYGRGTPVWSASSAPSRKWLLYELKFSRWFYFHEFREPNPRENFHFNLCLFIVMRTSAKSRN